MELALLPEQRVVPRLCPRESVFSLGMVCFTSFHADRTSSGPRNMSPLVGSLSDTGKVSWSRDVPDQGGTMVWKKLCDGMFYALLWSDPEMS